MTVPVEQMQVGGRVLYQRPDRNDPLGGWGAIAHIHTTPDGLVFVVKTETHFTAAEIAEMPYYLPEVVTVTANSIALPVVDAMAPAA